MSRLSRLALAAGAWLVGVSAFAQSNYQTPAELIPEAHETPRVQAPLFFRETWRVTPGIPLLHPAGPGDTSNPSLQLKLYGPSGKDILMNGAPDLPGNPMHLWTGMCQHNCAATLRDKNNYVDLRGWGKIRWMTREGGLNQLHVIVKLADGAWLVSEHGDAVGIDHHISEFTLSDSRWIGLDINRVVTRGLLTYNVDLGKVDEIGFTTLMPGSGHGYGGYADVVWMEVYGKPVPRAGTHVGEAGSQQALAPFADKSVEDLIKDPRAHDLGAKLFTDNCASCHGADGRGKPGVPNLTQHDWPWGGAPADVIASISGGRTGLMPAWHDSMTPANIEDVLAYTLTLSGRSSTSGDPVHGKELFKTTCTSCHGTDGKGNKAIGAPNLTDQLWVYGGSVDAIRESIAKGRNALMPAFEESLDATSIKVLAAYVLGLNH